MFLTTDSNESVELLHAADILLAASGDGDGSDGHLGALDGGHEGDLELDGEPTHGVTVTDGSGLPGGGVDDEVDLSIPHQTDCVGHLVLIQLEHCDGVHSVVPEVGGGSLGCVDGESHLVQGLCCGKDVLLVIVVDGDVDSSLGGQLVSCCDQGLVACDVEVLVDSHDLSGGLHLGSEDGVDSDQLQEGDDGCLDGVVVRVRPP